MPTCSLLFMCVMVSWTWHILLGRCVLHWLVGAKGPENWSSPREKQCKSKKVPITLKDACPGQQARRWARCVLLQRAGSSCGLRGCIAVRPWHVEEPHACAKCSRSESRSSLGRAHLPAESARALIRAMGDVQPRVRQQPSMASWPCTVMVMYRDLMRRQCRFA
ncbi:hypothetical protein NDU88_002434 [Pleurodeles waltl]|uniref:Secreted protein n=1 Tax=Pleurodeles waltl TaxID=8319 RepID=A0AAV7M3X3_PLEWA|nr:hypothetical protein NDU88_002434 [Pleurodeles waltl]